MTYAHDAHCNTDHEAGPEECPPPQWKVGTMYDNFPDEAINQLQAARAEIVALNKLIKDMREKERMKNKRCALDVAGRVLNYDMGANTTIPMSDDAIASRVLFVADRLLKWFGDEAPDESRAITLEARVDGRPK